MHACMQQYNACVCTSEPIRKRLFFHEENRRYENQLQAAVLIVLNHQHV